MERKPTKMKTMTTKTMMMTMTKKPEAQRMLVTQPSQTAQALPPQRQHQTQGQARPRWT